MTTELGLIRDYSDILRICRDRMASLNVTFETVDTVSGLHCGYSARLIGPRPNRKLGVMSLPLILNSLGIALVAIVDEEQMARIADRLVPCRITRTTIPHWRNRRLAEQATTTTASKFGRT